MYRQRDSQRSIVMEGIASMKRRSIPVTLPLVREGLIRFEVMDSALPGFYGCSRLLDPKIVGS